MVQALVRGVQREANGDSSIAVNLQKFDGSLVRMLFMSVAWGGLWLHCNNKVVLSSSASEHANTQS